MLVRLELYDDTDVLVVDPFAVESMVETEREGSKVVKLRTHNDEVFWVADVERKAVDAVNAARAVIVTARS